MALRRLDHEDGRAGEIVASEREQPRDVSSERASADGPMCFTGVYVGMYATGNGRRASAPADFDWFEQTPMEPAGDVVG